MAGTAGVCISLGATAGAASANFLPGPAPALMWMDATTGAGPPNYPEYEPGYGTDPDASDGAALQWLPAGAAAAIGVASGVLWLHRRHLAVN